MTHVDKPLTTPNSIQIQLGQHYGIFIKKMNEITLF